TWVSIGNASTAEGMFWEAVNAIGVLKTPAIISIYDDGYGISVPNQFQMVKGNISAILQGFRRDPKGEEGYDLYTVPGWDYPALLEVYRTAAEIARERHIPALVHVTELTQPQGHSTSGSHERYKSPERLQWEQEHDCLRKMKEWMIEVGVASEEDFARWEEEDRATVESIRKEAWEAYQLPILTERQEVLTLLDEAVTLAPHLAEPLRRIRSDLTEIPHPLRRDLHSGVHKALALLRREPESVRAGLARWKRDQAQVNAARYGSHLYSGRALDVPQVRPRYADDPPRVPGFEVLNAAFDAILARDPRVVAFGEDVGRLGDVNQGFRGLQEKYGALRVADTGIRETTIVGQAIGLAMRGLRPIAEIQYLDYLLYALQIMSDDLATLLWRTAGGQKAPVIVRTRGHRLEGIWHSGSLMAGLIHLVRGMVVCVPRDMTRAAGFYNTLLQADEPGVVVEVLNGYRLREPLPENLAEITVPLGVPEVLREGEDVTIVTYGAMCRIALQAAERLAEVGVQAEVIDVQTLLPFDRHGVILESLKKTSRILFTDEDVPGGTTAYMMQEVIEKQGGYYYLDSPPRTLPGAPHRPAYGSDGDYWSKPNVESVFDAVYEMMYEVDPAAYPAIY
ncbi:MAG: transketolase, partial [Anaerolineae bacterium]